MGTQPAAIIEAADHAVAVGVQQQRPAGAIERPEIGRLVLEAGRPLVGCELHRVVQPDQRVAVVDIGGRRDGRGVPRHVQLRGVGRGQHAHGVGRAGAGPRRDLPDLAPQQIDLHEPGRASGVEPGDVEALAFRQLDDLPGEGAERHGEPQWSERRRRRDGMRRHTLDAHLCKGAAHRHRRLNAVELAGRGVVEELTAGLRWQEGQCGQRADGAGSPGRRHRRDTPSPGSAPSWIRPPAMLTPVNGSSANRAAPSRSA